MNASFRLERAATRASHFSTEEMRAIGVCYISIIGVSATHSSSHARQIYYEFPFAPYGGDVSRNFPFFRDRRFVIKLFNRLT